MLVTVQGKIKIIDFGAACDLSTGINFSPDGGLLDPRYSPPEELVMPTSAPRFPIPFLSTFVSPFIWTFYRPDLFDSYCTGIILLQMAIPELRTTLSTRTLNKEIAEAEYDLPLWRYRKENGGSRGTRGNLNFALLDRNNGAGWDLACRLVTKRNEYFRGRMSVEEALGHRFFSGQ